MVVVSTALPDQIQEEHQRLRREHDRGISLETATVPAVGPLAVLRETGLRDGSLTRTLEAAGRISAGGDQWKTSAAAGYASSSSALRLSWFV